MFLIAIDYSIHTVYLLRFHLTAIIFASIDNERLFDYVCAALPDAIYSLFLLQFLAIGKFSLGLYKERVHGALASHLHARLSEVHDWLTPPRIHFLYTPWPIPLVPSILRNVTSDYSACLERNINQSLLVGTLTVYPSIAKPLH